MKILHLPIKKKWFDMIKSGEKKEEYREMKDYWSNRLINKADQMRMDTEPGNEMAWKEFDIIRFKNGYQKNAPILDIEFKGIEIKKGNTEWGAKKGEVYFVIKLGEVM